MSKETKMPTKKELFEKEPDNFIHLSELILAVKKEEDNLMSAFVGSSNVLDLGGAMLILQRHITGHLDMIKLKRLKESDIINKLTKGIDLK